jgi:cell division protein FtsQ
VTGPVQKKLAFGGAGAGAEAKPRVRPTVMETDEAPFLRPKTRTRIRRTRRSLLARILLGAQVFAAVLLSVGGSWALVSSVLNSDRLKVRRLQVRGNHYLSEGEVRGLLGPSLGENILTLDIAEARARLGASPWVASATIRRSLPNALQVEIVERRPVALAEVDQLYLMDGDGTLIDIYGPRTSEFDLPVVRGLGGLSEDARREQALRAGTLLSELGEKGSEISEVTVEHGGDLRAVLRGSGVVVRMGAPPYRKRFDLFLTLRQELMERTPDAEYFDLRFRDRILAKLPSSKAVAAATGPWGSMAPAALGQAPPPIRD